MTSATAVKQETPRETIKRMKAEQIARALESQQADKIRKRNLALALVCSDYWIGQVNGKRIPYHGYKCPCRNCARHEGRRVIARRQWPKPYCGLMAQTRSLPDGSIRRTVKRMSFECWLEKQKVEIEDGKWTTSSPTVASLELARRMRREGKNVKLGKGMRLAPESEAALIHQMEREGWVRTRSGWRKKDSNEKPEDSK